MKNFIDDYLNNLKKIFDTIDRDEVVKIKEAIDKTQEVGSKIYIIGNGGSAATSSHMANDLGIGLKRRNIRNFNVESLSDNSSVCTAIANDIGYENIFYMQLKDKIAKEDLLIAISCSGNSENIMKAVNHANKMGSTVVGLSGFDGGELKKASDINFYIETQKGEYGLVEDAHMILDHILYSYYISLED
ncbi:MAG: SIS domain-containing protein [Helicobacteraceae bacterium]|nr:SIS domain-containing protein [Helicobacteraceae bacterium]